MIDGLRTTEGQPVPLLGVHVQAEVVGGHTRVKVRQRYKNAESKPIEAVYTFPLPSDATVSGFTMICEGRRLEGVVQEREQAFRNYDEAITQGHGAALLEQERKNVFTATIGNLLPHEETLIEVEYLQRLTADEGALRWMLPTLVAPRYIPGSAQGNRTGGGWADPTDAVPDADRITPKIGDVKYGLKLELVFDLGVEVNVESPSHRIVATKVEGRTKVSFEQSEVALNRDVVVIARGVKGMLAGVTAHREDEQPGFFALTVVPDLFEPGKPSTPQEVVFLVDTSGSMDGESLPQAKAAMKLCLRHLREGDRFNIVQFNDRATLFAQSMQPFSQQALQSADRWVEQLHADGSTELLIPMVTATAMVPNGIVVLLTDGQVGNEQQILERVLGARKTTRVYSFGIGTNVSDQLLRDLAKQTQGGVEFIHPGERIDEKVTATFAKAIAPRVSDVEVKFVGLESGELAPSVLPPLIDGEPWTLFGRYASASKGHVELRGKRGDQAFVLQIPAELPARSAASALRPLWASERIADFETQKIQGRRADLMKERITKLAIEFGVSSAYTSFLVIEKREGDRRSNAQPETRFVPVSKPAGWDMFQSQDLMVGGAAPVAASAPVYSSAPLYEEAFDEPAPPQNPGRARFPSPKLEALRSKRAAASQPPAPAPAAPARFAPSEVTGAPAPAKGGGGIFQKMKDIFGGSDQQKKEAAPALDYMEMEREVSDGAFDHEAAQAQLTNLMSRQLASGLWDDSTKEPQDLRQLKATSKVLLTLLRDGITTAHAVYGGQVRKAVEALVQLAASIGSRDTSAVELALSIAWLVSTGQRTRASISLAAQGHAALLQRFQDEAALRAEVEQVRLAP